MPKTLFSLIIASLPITHNSLLPMEMSSMEMDIEEWEFLPISNDSRTFFEFGFESGKNLLFSKEAVVDNHYFILPSQPPKTQEVTKNSTLEKDRKEEDSLVKFKDIGIVPSPKVIIDQRDFTSQAIFKKLKGDEFVDMNVETPKFSIGGKIMVLSGDKEEDFSEDKKCLSIVKEVKDEEKDCENRDDKEKPSCEGFGLKGWRWKLVRGVGALCSIGVGAATICIIVLGCKEPKHESHSQRLQFQIYADENRIKQVMQRATKMDHAFATISRVPMTRANISFGGYYDGI